MPCDTAFPAFPSQQHGNAARVARFGCARALFGFVEFADSHPPNRGGGVRVTLLVYPSRVVCNDTDASLNQPILDLLLKKDGRCTESPAFVIVLSRALTDTMQEFPLLCRLCGARTENGLYIYCDEGKQRQVETKIRLYLHFQVSFLARLHSPFPFFEPSSNVQYTPDSYSNCNNFPLFDNTSIKASRS